MSRFLSAGIVAIAAISLAACSETPVAPTKEMSVPNLALAKMSGTDDVEQIVPGEVLVKFKDGIDATAKAHGKGLGLLKKGYGDAFVILASGKGNENAIVNSLKNDKDVEWVEPNYLRQPDAIKPQLWAFSKIGRASCRAGV